MTFLRYKNYTKFGDVTRPKSSVIMIVVEIVDGRSYQDILFFEFWDIESLSSCILGNISNMRNSVSSGYPNTEKRVENTTRSGVFLTKFEVFG